MCVRKGAEGAEKREGEVDYEAADAVCKHRGSAPCAGEVDAENTETLV